MKIVVTRTAVGQLLGYVILAALLLALSYLATAWVWWEMNPGYWSFGARGTALGFVLFLIATRWLANSIVVAPPVADEE